MKRALDLNDFMGKNTLLISEAMMVINNNTFGIMFLIDDEKKLRGCVTDGDIRRYLLGGGQVSDIVENAANPKPRVARSLDEAKKLFHKRNYIVIPIIDEYGVIIDVFCGNGCTNYKAKKPLKLPVVINAGGKGTRLDPFTRVLPKPLIPVGEHPIIELIMKEYLEYECCDFSIIVNYKKELIKAYFTDSDLDYKIRWYDESKPLGTGGGLCYLKGEIDQTFFFANCDVLIKADYENMVAFHKENDNAITMICAYKNIEIPYGVVEMGVDGRIEGMKEKPVMSFLTNTGCYIVEPEVLDDLVDGEVIGFPDIIERQKEKGRKVAVYPISENDWMDMGQLPELEKMRIRLYGE